MEINTPQHHDFSQSLRDKISSETDYSLPEWEISAPRENDLAWPIVLSYLMSTDYRNPEDFGKRLEALTGNKENEEVIKKSIRNFNPFRDRYFCYKNNNLKTVVNNFRKYLKWQNLPSVPDKLNAASKAKECPILLVFQHYKISENYEIFNKANGNIKNFITLIAVNDLNSPRYSITDCNFMIGGISGLQMKTAALKYYLNKTDIPKKIIKKLIPVIAKENNFIKAVLNSEYKEYIFYVYKSLYVVTKLSEAGYEMDPRKKDSEGFSGLYYALRDNISSYSYYFYGFIVDKFELFQEADQNSALNIVSHLQSMRVLLSDVSEKIAKETDLENTFRKLSLEKKEISTEENSQNYYEMKKKCDELLQFNLFLIEWHSKFLKIKNKSNCDDSISEKIFEAEKRRDIITSLLDTYEKFFFYQNNSALDEYILHKIYCDSIDRATTRYFFNNIAPLKERIKLDKKSFSEIESSLFFYNLLKYGFEKLRYIRDGIKTSNPNCRLRTLYMVLYSHRLEIYEKLKAFNRILHDTSINERNITDHIPETEIYSALDSYCFVKDFIGIARLWDHTKTCESIRKIDTKSILVIEHVLQVIGEGIPPEEKIEFSYKRLLSLCFPKKISQVLHCLRNVLTHSEIHHFQSRFECENDICLFTSIKNEIAEIKKYIRLVYRIMVLNMDVHIINIFNDKVKKAIDFIHSQPHSSTDTSCLNKDIKFGAPYIDELFQRDKLLYHMFFKIALQKLKDEIENEYTSKKGSVQDKKNRIISLLWPIKWLLELFQKCNIYSAVIPLNSLKELKEIPVVSLNALKDKTDIFMKECYNFLPIFNVKQTRSPTSALKSLEHIERFQKLLNGFSYLSDIEIDKIRKTMSKIINPQVSLKTKFEELIATNYVNKKLYDKFCDELQFSGKARGELKKLVPGSRIKVSMNKLEILLSRIKLLKEIAIDENEEIHELWINKQENMLDLIKEKIAQICFNDLQFLYAVQMLLLDCMNLSQIVKKKNAWYKSTVLFEGINFRNLISHGNPIVEVLNRVSDSDEIELETANKILLLIEGEDAIIAILELYKLINNDFAKLLDIINCDQNDDYCQLRNRIKNRNEWNDYVLLLPAKRRRECTKDSNVKRGKKP